MKKLFLAIAFSIICFFMAVPVGANAVYDAKTTVELKSENASIAPGEPFWVALVMTMDPHWHVYWRNPGDSGLSPKIDWQLPKGFEAEDIQWPYPKRIDLPGLTSYGYDGQVLLLTRVIPPENIKENSVELKAHVNWLACEVPCIPGTADLSLSIPVTTHGAVFNPKEREAFELTRAKLPQKETELEIHAVDDGEFIKLILPESWVGKSQNVQFYPFKDNVIVHAAEQRLEKNAEFKTHSLFVKKNLYFGKTASLQRVEGVVVAGTKSVVIDAPLEKPAVAVSEAESMTSGGPVIFMLFFAFLGGVILNLMPCVFPVLSIKVLNVINRSHGKAALIKSAVGFAAGVTASFVALAVMLIIFRSAGQAIGWGFQFQSPFFVIAMAFLFFVLALNFFGIFELDLSFKLSAKNAPEGGMSESFLSGILAVLVATPCTAPFMGTAIGFALSQSDFVNLLIFVFLGIGMALPFVVLLLSPALLNKLPKPGVWMENFKKFLGFPLLATVVWLLWVLAGQKGASAVIWVLTGMLLTAFGLWLKAAVKTKSILITALIVISISTGILAPFHFVQEILSEESNLLTGKESAFVWKPFNPTYLEVPAVGKIVFIDFTARWCLTCQVNKKIALENKDVINAFQERGVVAVSADWTNRDEDITRALASFGKNSVPLYVFIYEQEGQRKVQLLPELLTPQVVLELLKKIKP